MEFVYKHRKVLLTAAAVAIFATHTDEFIEGTRDIAEIAAVNIGKPLAETPGRIGEKAVEQMAPEIGRSTNWTVVFLGALVAVTILSAGVIRARRPSHTPPQAS